MLFIARTMLQRSGKRKSGFRRFASDTQITSVLFVLRLPVDVKKSEAGPPSLETIPLYASSMAACMYRFSAAPINCCGSLISFSHFLPVLSAIILP